MKFPTGAILLFAVGACASYDAGDTFKPQRISFSDLETTTGDIDSAFIDALTSVGIVAIKDIPEYASLRIQTLSSLTKCAHSSHSGSKSHTFDDGTVRTTLATRTIPGPGGAQPIIQTSKIAPEDCREFEESSLRLRAVVDETTRAFSTKLASIIGRQADTHAHAGALLETRDGFQFSDFAAIANEGEHLEHFHSYDNPSTNESHEEKTLDFHTDQGIFIAFTPALSSSGDAAGTGHFFIMREDGSRPEVEFEDSDLIFMLGDGVNQIVNPHHEASYQALRLRAVPHAMNMPDLANRSVRTWYGRMVLPPVDAVHPENGKTFGEIRELMISGQEEVLGLACTGSASARQLEEVLCEEGTLYCWHRCMNHTEYYPVSPDICADDGLELKCVNPRGQHYVKGHGDFYPNCAPANTVPATPFPTLPTYPRDNVTCSQEEWNKYAGTTGEYAYCHDIGKFDKARFCWSVDGGSIDGRLSYNGLYGYLAFGFSSGGEGIMGMFGAEIIMGLPGGNFTPVDGLDLSLNATVKEYVISDAYTRFRHWSQPVPDRDTSSYAVNSTDCFTSLTFKTDSINSRTFNVTGTDVMLWAANGKDTFVEFHGQDQRDLFEIEWASGSVTQISGVEKEEHSPDGGEHDKKDGATPSSDSTKKTLASSFLGMAALFWMLGSHWP